MLKFLDELDRSQAHPEFVAIIDALQLKHNTIPQVINVRFAKHPFRHEEWTANFFDDRFPFIKNIIGSLSYTIGNRSDKEFAIESRLISNAKYSPWSNEHKVHRTKDIKKAIKIALDKLKPFAWHEVTHNAREIASKHHTGWANTNIESRESFRMDNDTFASELANLIEQGVVFKTDKFKKAAENLPKYLEYRERQKAQPKMDTIMVYNEMIVFMESGRITEHKILNSIEELPEGHQQKMALLKLVEDGEFIPEVGYKHEGNRYVVYQ